METMQAMVLRRLGRLDQHPDPLEAAELPLPEPGPGEVRVRVAACGVCHTELDEIEGRTPPPRLPVVPGHQAVGRVDTLGPHCQRLSPGDRVGVAWIHGACGRCAYCRRGEENLCPGFCATGRDVDGGYAQYLCVPEAFAHPIPDAFDDCEAAPLLCAGAIGHRALGLANLRPGQALGLTGFGASAHLVLQLARHRHPGLEVYVFARSETERAFARELGATWAGATEQRPPRPLDAIIDTTPAWRPVVAALAALAPGGRLVINAIRKEAGDQDALLALDYPTHLWLEKEIKSVANVARADVGGFLAEAAAMGLKPAYQAYPLSEANRALRELKAGRIRGAKVLRID